MLVHQRVLLVLFQQYSHIPGFGITKTCTYSDQWERGYLPVKPDNEISTCGKNRNRFTLKWPVWGIYPQFQTHPNEGLSKSKFFLGNPGRMKQIPSGNQTWQFNIPKSCGFDCFNGKIIEHSWEKCPLPIIAMFEKTWKVNWTTCWATSHIPSGYLT